MYILSFFKSLLHPRNFLSALYFLLNLAVIFGVFYLINLPIVPDNDLNAVYSGLIGVGANMVLIFISLSPFGEFFWRLRNGIKKAPPQGYEGVWATANAAFEEVKSAARQKSRTVSKKVTLYYSPEKQVNAFALGHRTVILTDGMLRKNNSGVFRGVIAHELGHIAHGDSDLNLGINVCNTFIVIFMSVISIFAYAIVGALMYQRNRNFVWLAFLLRIFFNVIVVGVFKLWTLLGVFCINATSRKKEYAADKFAKDIGYGRELSAFLSSLGGGKPSSKWYSLMYQSHPATPDRVKALAA